MAPSASDGASWVTPSGASAASDNGTEVTLSATTSTTHGAESRLGPRAALLRHSREDRWEAEVARSVGSSIGRSEALNTRGSRDFTSSEGLNTLSSRNAARLTMKSTGARLAEFSTTGGSCLKEDDTVEAANRAQQRRMDKKKEALAAEAVKATERAAKMAATRKKAKQTQLRHELRIHEVAAKKSAVEAQAQHDKDVLHDIVLRRREAQQRIAERAAQDDSIECILQWALPEAKTAHEALRLLGGHVGDDNTVLKLMAKDLGKGDDSAVLKLMERGAGQSHDDNTVLNLVTKGLGKVDDDDAVLKLMAKGGDKAHDDGTILNLMTKDGGKDSKDDEVLRLLAKGTGHIRDDDTMLTLMGKTNDADSTTMHRLMAKTNLANASLEDTNALLNLMRKETKVDNPTIRGLIQSDLKDDEAFRRAVGPVSGREEARINADALRFILGGTTDPVTRLAQLARNRPKAGRSKANADASQAVRDLQLLNQMLEMSDADVDIQAWKDVGAIHMFMQNLPGPDREKRPRANTQTDNDAMQALMGGPPSQQGVQAAADMSAVQRLLGQNMLQPSGCSSGALGRLIGQSPSQQDIKAADTKIVQQMMSPRGLTAQQPAQPSNQNDTDLINQLMGTPRNSPLPTRPVQGFPGGYAGGMAPTPPGGLLGGTQAPNLLGSYPGGGSQAPNLLGSYPGGGSQAPNLLGSYPGSMAPTSSGGLIGARQAPNLQQQDTRAAFNLMDSSSGTSQGQNMRDVNALQSLLR